jgi:hypothetical protein
MLNEKIIPKGTEFFEVQLEYAIKAIAFLKDAITKT